MSFEYVTWEIVFHEAGWEQIIERQSEQSEQSEHDDRWCANYGVIGPRINGEDPVVFPLVLNWAKIDGKMQCTATPLMEVLGSMPVDVVYKMFSPHFAALVSILRKKYRLASSDIAQVLADVRGVEADRPLVVRVGDQVCFTTERTSDKDLENAYGRVSTIEVRNEEAWIEIQQYLDEDAKSSQQVWVHAEQVIEVFGEWGTGWYEPDE